jgi:hypothetical protein
MRLKFMCGPIILGLVFMGAPAWGQGKEKPPTVPVQEAQKPVTSPTSATAEKRNPQEVLRQMCDYLRSLKEFSFKGEVTDDHTYSGGNKLQFAFGVEGYVKRPDKIRINAKGDQQNKEVLYDGKTFTIYDTGKNFYVNATMPATIDEALAKLNSDYNIRLIVADLAKTNLFDSITEGVTDQVNVGEGTVFGVKCQHIAFDKKKIEVQLWVEDSDKPVLRKAVITFKDVEFSPQWTLYLTEWNVSPQLADSLFTFTPPQGAVKANFIEEIQKAGAAKKGKGQRKKKGDRS